MNDPKLRLSITINVVLLAVCVGMSINAVYRQIEITNSVYKQSKEWEDVHKQLQQIIFDKDAEIKRLLQP